ncbi:MAG: nitroreductase [Candidatus Marinimicrobia bacterium CG08_land_8_20_14_0_20_45_22]|nr:MAG: nitroreductase [Candidatus Marinimicrobia bacterium CG08_land_8_20_14_0_20_45_22]
MEFSDLIQQRRSFRSLAPVRITREMVLEIASTVSLSPSCFNNQPWRFVFVTNPKKLQELFAALSPGNDWAKKASAIAAIFSKKEFDCVIKEREYFLFDAGMATAFLLLKATEMGLVAHPIAGFDYQAVKTALQLPDKISLIALVIIGRKSEAIDVSLSEKQKAMELTRPERFTMEKFVWFDEYT